MEKVIPIPPVFQYKVPERPTALSWEDIQTALKQGKKCRRLQWDEDCYIKQERSGIVFHFTYYNDNKKGTCQYEITDMAFQEDIEEHDWIIIDNNKKK